MTKTIISDWLTNIDDLSGCVDVGRVHALHGGHHGGDVLLSPSQLVGGYVNTSNWHGLCILIAGKADKKKYYPLFIYKYIIRADVRTWTQKLVMSVMLLTITPFLSPILGSIMPGFLV